MQRIHLLRVEETLAAFSSLFAAAAARKVRLGWLDLEPPEASPPGEVALAASAGARPAVEVAGRRVTSVRWLEGPPVLRDLLRRDFLGCRAVLVRGTTDAPLLVPEAEGWRVTSPGQAGRVWGAEQLLEALGHPRPWE